MEDVDDIKKQMVRDHKDKVSEMQVEIQDHKKS